MILESIFHENMRVSERRIQFNQNKEVQSLISALFSLSTTNRPVPLPFSIDSCNSSRK